MTGPDPELVAFAEPPDGTMYVVTAAAADGARAGCLVGFASQCSIHPPRFIVWLSTANHTLRVAREASFLAVHVLGGDQRELAELFGTECGARVDKFARVPWRPSADGAPVLSEARAWFVGRIERRMEGTGDHMGFLLAPVEQSPDRDAGPAPRLLALRDVEGLTPGHPA
ncbi:flavin reductase family protein [Streptomyces goshikiensis]|uniref:flavin reductase family protein n=1 Tax=Streptomyces goshikiensis TaxID=1942 RepID=UPI0036CBA61E